MWNVEGDCSWKNLCVLEPGKGAGEMSKGVPIIKS